MTQADSIYDDHAMYARPKLSMLPSELIRRQCAATFMYDPVAINNRHITGLDTLMWGNDYPHPEGTWPSSQSALADQFDGVPDDEVRAIVGGNAARMFGFAVGTRYPTVTDALPGRGVSASTTMAWDWDLGQCIDAVDVRRTSGDRHHLRPARGVRARPGDAAAPRPWARDPRTTRASTCTTSGSRPDTRRCRRGRSSTSTLRSSSAPTGSTRQPDPVARARGPRPRGHIAEQTAALLPELHVCDLRLAIEPVHPLRQDITFLNTAADTIDVLEEIDDPSVGYVFDTWHLWWERGIEEPRVV